MLLSTTVLHAAEDEEDNQPALDPYGRTSPRGTVSGFLDAIDQGDLQRASEYMDLRYLPRELGQYTPEQMAIGLSIVLERAALLELDSFSNENTGYLNEDLPDYRDLLASIRLEGGQYEMYLQRVPGDSGFIWKVSNATISDLQKLYDEYRYNRYVEWLLRNTPDIHIAGIELFKLLASFSNMLVSIPLLLIIGFALSRLFSRPGRSMYVPVRHFFMGPFIVFFAVIVLISSLQELGGRSVQELTRGKTLILLTGLWVCFRLLDIGRLLYADKLKKNGREGTLSLLKPIGQAIKSLIALMFILVWLDNMGYSITALLTGLGVGGVAVALVLQRPLEDILGAFTLYAQQPIRIGDFGKYGEIIGTIEEISLRTTRIRTLANTLVSVPNHKMAAEPIENYSARSKILYNPVILFSNQTSFSTMEEIVEQIKQLLKEDDEVLDPASRVNFTSIAREGFELTVFAYINTTDWVAYLHAAEKLNFAILKIIDAHNASLFNWGRELFVQEEGKTA